MNQPLLFTNDGMLHDARIQYCFSDDVRTSQQHYYIVFNLQIIWYLYFLSISRSIITPLSFTRSPGNLPLTSHRITKPNQTASRRAAPHCTVPHHQQRSLSLSLSFSLSRYCKLLTAPCYSAYCLLSATPSSATPAPCHSFPPPVAP